MSGAEVEPKRPPLRLADWMRLVRGLHSRFVLRRCAEVGLAPWVDGTVWIHDGGTVRIGDRVRFNARAAPIELRALHGAEIRIGNDVCLEGGTSIEAHTVVTIGDGTVVEGYCKIVDSHFHALRGDRQRRPESVAVTIEENVVVSRRAIVLPGARVRAGTVVRPATVVQRAPLAPAPPPEPFPTPGV